MSYRENRSWSDRYIPEIKRIVGPLLLEPSSFDVDTKEATDLIVLTARDMRIAARVRRPEYCRDRYAQQFTIRLHSNGHKTEWQKIVYEGWGDWLFYGFAADEGVAFQRWYVINLDIFRGHHGINARIKSETCNNGDGTRLRAYDLPSFDPEILIASSHSIQFQTDLFSEAG